MREIKFRAWDKKRNRYVGDGEIVFKSYGSKTAVVICPNSQDYIGDICHDEYIDDGRFVVEQYTGLKDKNGKEIYEGDIVKNIEGVNETAVCIWDESNAEFDFRCKDGKYTRDNVKSWLEMYEVISNIHEDKELLDGHRED